MAEAPLDSPSMSALLLEVDISDNLSTDQQVKIEAVILKHASAFGLDGRLGNYDEQVDITMKPGTTPVSLPSFPASPAKHEVIDKQMDSWIKLGVIKPSKSPWAAPVFIVYHNIPDEFPIPKQEDIFQTLTGLQWLTTFVWIYSTYYD
ncbi:hypothetical protein DXG01_004143 [Tephrocybe rancida]|nr:hypothetical protein DXG01_004143 [Tephrocybe rancida]